MGLLTGWFTGSLTVGRQIALAFSAMGGITAAVAGVSLVGAGQTDGMLGQAFDQGLVAARFARAVGEDFDRLRAEVVRTGQAKSLTVSVLDKSFKTNLAAAVAQSTSPEAGAAGESLGKAEAEWLDRSRQIESGGPSAAKDRATADALSRTIGAQVDALVGRAVDLAYDQRAAAGRLMTAQSTLAVGAGLGGLMIAGLAAGFLARSLRSPLRRATAFAHAAAEGRSEPQPPGAGSDEIGELVNAITALHRESRGRTEAERTRRDQFQTQIRNALDDSREGVLIIDGGGTVQVANARAMDFLGIGKALAPGTTLDQVRTLVGLRDETRQSLLAAGDEGQLPAEILLPDARRIRRTRSRMADGGLAWLYSDVTALVTSHEDLSAAKANLDAALANMNQALCLFDANRTLKVANGRFYTMFGLGPEEVRPGMGFDEILSLSHARGNHPGLDADRLRRHGRFVFARTSKVRRTMPFRGDLTLCITQTPVQCGDRLFTAEDVTEQRRVNERIVHLGRHDALTGLPSRAFLLERLDRALTRPGREAVGLLCLDLDGFKTVNDALGPDVGDALLKAAAARLSALAGPAGFVARLGGDEFALLLQAGVTRQSCAVAAKGAIETLSVPFEIGSSTVNVGASVGVLLSAGEEDRQAAQAMQCAGLALFKAKEDGQGLFRFYDPEMENRLTARLTLEADLRRAVNEREFEVYYQPLLDLASMRIGGFEALIRWNHPVRGLVSPGAFIPLAESIGLIDRIGAWVLDDATRQAARWPRDLKLAVNVSIVQLRDGSFTDVVRRTLAASGFEASRLELEITESVFMANNAKPLDTLKSLKGLGVRFAMDDFGTGYSSLSTLRRFPFDKIKIDRAFINDAIDGQGQHILKTIVMLGKSLGMRVTAEGVETPRQLKHLAEIGCDDIQGFLVGRPMPADTIAATLAQHNGEAEPLGEAA